MPCLDAKIYSHWFLGTGHYLSPGGGGKEDIGGITWFLGEKKGRSVVIENPKGEITENFGRITEEGEPIKFAWMDLWKRKVNYVAMFLVVCQLSRDVIVYEDS